MSDARRSDREVLGLRRAGGAGSACGTTGIPPGGVSARDCSSICTRSTACAWPGGARRSAYAARACRRRRSAGWSRRTCARRSMDGTSVIFSPAAATRQLSTVSISKPSPQSIPSAAAAARPMSGRSSTGRRSAQNAL